MCRSGCRDGCGDAVAGWRWCVEGVRVPRVPRVGLPGGYEEEWSTTRALRDW